jgi:hypothetical protein
MIQNAQWRLVRLSKAVSVQTYGPGDIEPPC